jgi:serine/threonine protein kinase
VSAFERLLVEWRRSQHTTKFRSDAPSGRLALVFELMECNIYEMIKGKRKYLPESQVKGLMYQLFKGIDHMHR